MKALSILSLSLVLLSGTSAFAMETITYTCKHTSGERLIQVVYETEGSQVPCKVLYQKSSSEPQELWSARAQVGYCEEKATSFVEKQRSWGWNCEQNASSQVESESSSSTATESESAESSKEATAHDVESAAPPAGSPMP